MQPAPLVAAVAVVHLVVLVMLESFAALAPAVVAYGAAVLMTRRMADRDVRSRE